MKRVFDIIAAGAGVIVLSPLFVALAILVRISSPGAVLYRALRVGRDGKTFRLLKFRSMVAGADRLGPGITTAGDDRVTGIGRFLRRTKLDELPQLINVVRGEMSLVGPRPEDPRYVALYTPEQRRVLRERPGITSPASFAFRDESERLTGPDWERTYIDHILPQKLQMELDYLERHNLCTDLQLIFRTIFGAPD